MVGTQAIVGDIVPPRDRGRYQGLFGAVFGVASVAGPLLGRGLRRAALLALDLLHQRPDRRPGARSSSPAASRATAADPPRHRLPGHGVPRAGGQLPRAFHQPRGHDLSVGLGARSSASGSAGVVFTGHLRPRRAQGDRAGAASPSLLRPHLHRRELRRLHRRLRDVRLHHLPARLLPDRPRRVADDLGAAAAALDGGHARRLDRLGPDHQPDRPLPDLPHRRNLRHHARPVSPLAHGCLDGHGCRRPLHGRARPRASVR